MRTAVLTGLLAALFPLVTQAGQAAGGAKKPNIIFILADDLGYGDLGCYGQEKIQTPNLDRLAAQGMRFTQAYAGSTVCAPSRCVLMTGLHTGHCRIRGNARFPLEPGDVTVAEVLKRAGYRTALIGKWGLGEAGSTGVPTRQGFDYYFGYLNQHHAHNYYPDYLWRNEEKVSLPNKIGPKDNVAVEKEVYSHDLFLKEAVQWLKANKDGPFFLYLALTIPHANNEAGQEGMEVPSDEPYSKEPWPQAQKNHAAMITYMDKGIGRLMALLSELGLDENTIVFFSSDNGPHREGGGDPAFFNSSGSLRGFKRSLHEGGIRVPMIVRWTGHVPAGTTSDQPFPFWDFLPTAAGLAGVAPPEDIDGVSVLPTLLGHKGQKDHEGLYWEFHEGKFAQGVRLGDWKAVRYNLDDLELYNLAKDPREENNVAAGHPDVVARIEAYLRRARADSEQWPIKVGGGNKKKKAG